MDSRPASITSARCCAPNPLEQPGDGSGYAPTYYPGTGNANEAQRVAVGAGDEVSIGFSLLPVRLVRISGTVVSQSGEGGGMVQLVSAGDSAGRPASPVWARIQNDGSFTIATSRPGRTCSTRAPADAADAAARAACDRCDGVEIGSLPIVVADSDVTGVTISLTRGASIAGTVVTEGTAQITLSNLRVTARQIRDAPGQAFNASGVERHRRFQLSTLTGTVALRVENVPAQWMVKSIVVGSTDVTDGAFELRGTEQITNARIVLTDRVSELNGTVTVRNQEAKDSSVVVFADDAALWTFPTRFVRMARADAQGHFTLRGLPRRHLSGGGRGLSRRGRVAGPRVPRTPARAGHACVGPRRRDQDGRSCSSSRASGLATGPRDCQLIARQKSQSRQIPLDAFACIPLVTH
jgi:hypothetical protein